MACQLRRADDFWQFAAEARGEAPVSRERSVRCCSGLHDSRHPRQTFNLGATCNDCVASAATSAENTPESSNRDAVTLLLAFLLVCGGLQGNRELVSLRHRVTPGGC